MLLILAEMLISKIVTAQNEAADSVKTISLDEIVISTTRAGEKTPVAYTNLEKEDIESRNLGQDMPFLLRLTPSLVTTSDAGTGVGYTGMRIRGSDATRINITINGIPYNDAESQGTFWVNLPDFSSSLNSIQIQRGVGTSTNGAGAFGASVNMETSAPANEAFGEINNSVGSFGTRKHNIIINSGLINNHWSFEGRLSKIASDGYVDRASADLKSYFLSGSYIGKSTTLKALVFGGKEVTYQAWYGTPEAVLDNDRDGIEEVLANNGLNAEQAKNIRNDGRTFNWYFYDNEVDNYTQDHYQLHLSQSLGNSMSFNLSGHYTYGRGYFEQFKEGEDLLEDYGLPYVTVGSETVTESDIIRRRWLDNDFYGFTYGLNFNESKVNATLGGGYHYYSGDHFGEVIWAQYGSSSNIRERYYDNVGEKKDFNSFLKLNYGLSDKVNLYGDLQLRTVNYQSVGVDSDRQIIDIGNDFVFFNPKFGLSYAVTNNSSLYASYAIGNREPDRNDFIDSPSLPKHETLRDLEIGCKVSGANIIFDVNTYYMNYKNQLVLTGELNDVGSNIRTNAPNSHRTGIEISGGIQLTDMLNWSGNVTLSQNKIENFTEVLYDYGDTFDEFNVLENDFRDTDISFSPNTIVTSNWTLSPSNFMTASIISKYVGKQYLDNTSNEDRNIDAYFVNDFQAGFNFTSQLIKEIEIKLLINNVLGVEYESNGYTFGYFGGSYAVRENYYYPQAGRNFLLGLRLRF